MFLYLSHNNSPIQPVVTPCGHVFCSECAINLINTAENNGGECRCPTCRGDVDKKGLVPFSTVETFFKQRDSENNAIPENTTDNSDGIREELRKEVENELQPSTKIKELVRVLEETRRDCPGEKTVVFCSFTKFLDLCEPNLRKIGINFVRVSTIMLSYTITYT